jgi:NhaP-type Na+/H+ or K+/H+ antiporter
VEGVSAVDVLLVGGALLGYALLSRRLAGSPVSPAIVFVVVGMVVGSGALDLLRMPVGSSELRTLAEVTLALVLFTDASRLDSRRVVRGWQLPGRLLGVALPVTILLGGALAVLVVPGLAVFEAVALAVLLAPTDAALGQAVVSDERVPSAVRDGLSVESGLNDGVCVPLLIGALSIAELEAEPEFRGEILRNLVVEIAVALLVGALVGLAVATLTRLSDRRGWVSGDWWRVVPLVAAALAYVGTDVLGGSGFIGAFAAGLVYGRVVGSAAAHRSTELSEELGSYLSAVTFLLFGAVLVPPALAALDVWTVLYAVLSLTLVRMVPVALALAGTGARAPTRGFVGWFGPRGLATVVFALTVVEQFDLPGGPRIVAVATVTVLLSVLAHGLSASALTSRYARWLKGNRDPLAAPDVPTASP